MHNRRQSIDKETTFFRKSMEEPAIYYHDWSLRRSVYMEEIYLRVKRTMFKSLTICIFIYIYITYICMCIRNNRNLPHTSRFGFFKARRSCQLYLYRRVTWSCETYIRNHVNLITLTAVNHNHVIVGPWVLNYTLNNVMALTRIFQLPTFREAMLVNESDDYL